MCSYPDCSHGDGALEDDDDDDGAEDVTGHDGRSQSISCCCEPNSEIGEDCRGRPCRALSDRGTEGQNEAGRGVAENGPAEASLLCGAGL